MKLQDFNDKHKGETIFIFGNDEELAGLSESQLSTLSSYTTIGVNYSHLVHIPTYMISGHFSHVLYAREVSDLSKTQAIFFQGKKEGIGKFNVDKLVPIQSKYFYMDLSMEIPRRITPDKNYLVGSSNIMLSSTNLAYIMGAKRIVFIGFNQKNRSHFYDSNEDLKSEIRENILRIKEKYKLKDYPRMAEVNADYDMFQEHMLPLEVLRKIQFFPPDISPAIKKLFDTLRANGVELISTKGHSKLVDAGAMHKDLDSILRDLSNDTE